MPGVNDQAVVFEGFAIAESPLRVLSLFSGAGGLDVGLERAGYEVLSTIESDETARRSLELNYPGRPQAKYADVLEAASDLYPKDLGIEAGDLELIAGGPPCQPFSTAGQWAASGRSGMADPRAKTVTAMLALVDRFLPAALMIENVAGFLQGANSAAPIIEAALQSTNRRHGTNYNFSWSVVNASDYGVPQNRRRVVAVAARDGHTFEMPAPTHADHPLTVWDALADLKVQDPPAAQGKWADLLPLIPPGWNYQWLSKAGGGPELFGYRTRYWSFLLKLSPMLPSWTLPASPGPSTGPFHWANRPLAPEELARLQSFPDTWLFGGNSHRDKVRLIGNATPPLLAEIVGIALAKQLFDAQDKTPSLTIARTDVPMPDVPIVAGLPSKYLEQVGHKDPHAGQGLGPAPRLVPELTSGQ